MTRNNSPSRRQFVRTTAGIGTAAMLSLAGCTSGSGGGKSGGGNGNGSKSGSKKGGKKGGKSDVEFWSSSNKQELQFHKSAKQAFVKQNDVSVSVRPVPEGDSSEQVVLSALASGTEPDVFANVAPPFAAQLQANNAVKNLYDIDGAKDYLTKRCGKTTLKRYEAPDGKLYQAPWKSNPVLFQYNDTVFEKAGYDKSDYPQTLDDLITIGKKLVDKGTVKVLWDRAPQSTWYQRWFDFIPLYLAASEGKKSMFEQGSNGLEPSFNNDTAVTVLQFFQKLYGQKLAPTQPSEKPKFPHDEAAINSGGPWVIPSFKGVNKDVKMSHLTPPVPKGVSPNANTYADPKNISIFGSAKQPKAAWQFIDFEIQEQWDTKFLKQTLQLPLRKGLTDSASSFFDKHPDIEPYANALDTSHPPAYTSHYQKLMDTFNQKAYVPIVTGKKDPQKGLDEAEQAMKGILQQ